MRYGGAGALAFLLLALPAVVVRAGEADLHEGPVLVIEPGAHMASIGSIDADRDGRFLVTASDDKTVRVWSAADGALLRTLRLPAGPGDVGKAYAAAISPDGTLVAAGGWTAPEGVEQSVYLFDRETGRLLRRVAGLADVTSDLAFSPDGRRLAVALGAGSGVRLADTGTGAIVASHDGYRDGSHGVAFDPAGRLATTSSDGRVRLYDAGLNLLASATTSGGEHPAGIAFSPDGARLAVGHTDGPVIDVFDATTLTLLFATEGAGMGRGSLGSVAWSSDGGLLWAGGAWPGGTDVRLSAWADGGRGDRRSGRIAYNTVMDIVALPGGRLAFGAADPRLGIAGPDDASAVWSRGPVKNDFRGQQGRLRISADGTRVAFRQDRWDEAAKRWDQQQTVFSLSTRQLAPGPVPVGLAAAKTRARDLAVRGWDGGERPTLNGKPLPTGSGETSRALALAPDGKRFVLATDWSLRLFDGNGRVVWRKDVPETPWSVNVSGDGRLVVAAYGDGTIRWHRLEDGEELLAFFPHPDRELWVLWTPAGYYDAPLGAESLIGWHVNHGWDEAPELLPASAFRDRFRRPDVIDRVLQELDVGRPRGAGRGRREVNRAGSPAAARVAVRPRELPGSGAEAPDDRSAARRARVPSGERGRVDRATGGPP